MQFVCTCGYSQTRTGKTDVYMLYPDHARERAILQEVVTECATLVMLSFTSTDMLLQRCLMLHTLDTLRITADL